MRSTIPGILGSVLLIGAAWGQSTAKQSQPTKAAKTPIEKPAGPATPELAVLTRFAGPWEIAETHYNSRGEVVGSAKGIEDGAWILDGRVLRRTYTTGEEGHLFLAIGMIAWDAAQKQYKGSWFDNASTNGPTALMGTWDEASKTMTFTLTSTASDGKLVQHKVIDRFLDDEHRVVTTYKAIDNQVEKVMEVQFTRAKPCPANLKMMHEGVTPTKP